MFATELEVPTCRGCDRAITPYVTWCDGCAVFLQEAVDGADRDRAIEELTEDLRGVCDMIIAQRWPRDFHESLLRQKDEILAKLEKLHWSNPNKKEG